MELTFVDGDKDITKKNSIFGQMASDPTSRQLIAGHEIGTLHQPAGLVGLVT